MPAWRKANERASVVATTAALERLDDFGGEGGLGVRGETRKTERVTDGDDTDSDFSAERIKHMEMAQAVVARLGGNGFVVKGWAITVAGAFQGFSVTRKNGWLAIVGILPTVLFWFLDVSFLRSERAFRVLFERVRTGKTDAFFMNATSREHLQTLPEGEQNFLSWRRTILRLSLVAFYAALILTAVAVAVAIGVWGDGSEPPPAQSP